MKKILLTVMLAAACCCTAQAQTIKKNENVKIATPAQNPALRQVDEVTALRSQNAKLKQQVATLKKQVDQLLADAAKAKAAMPHCSVDGRTSTSGQGSRDCQPYNCDIVTGACMQGCATSDDCQPGTLCDMGAPGRCVHP